MNLKRLGAFALLLALALAAMAVPAPAAAGLPAQTNLLANGGLDSFSASGVATSWEPWWDHVPNPGTGSLDYVVKPEWSSETNPTFVQSGSGSQHIGRPWDPWYAGIRQTIDVPPGSLVRFSAYARAFASSQDHPAPSDSAVQSRMRIGAEPNGSIEWYSGTVVWSPAVNPHNTWQQVTLDVTAGATGKVTVFLSANFRGDSRLHLDTWWDNASAVIVGTGQQATSTPAAAATSGGGAQQPTSPPAQSPGLQRTPTPGPDGTIVYIVQAGDTLWSISAQSGVSIDQIRALNGLTGDIISVGQRLILGQGSPSSPDATETPAADETAEPGSEATPAGEAPAGGTSAPVAPTEQVPGGRVCALMWNDINGNGIRDTNESLLAGGQLSVVEIATGAPVASYTTDGLTEPHCFDELPAGRYTISSAAPIGYNGTTPNSTPLEVESGSTAILEFGAQASAATAEQGSGGPNPVLRTALFGAGGIVFLLLAVGMAAFLFLRRAK
jgi:LysM repeat protein